MKQAFRIGGYVARGSLLGAYMGSARLGIGRTARLPLTHTPAALGGAATSSGPLVRYASSAAAVAEVEEDEDFEDAEVSQGPTLRPYQEACVQECLANLAAGISRIGVSSPTGSGKVRSDALRASLTER